MSGKSEKSKIAIIAVIALLATVGTCYFGLLQASSLAYNWLNLGEPPKTTAIFDLINSLNSNSANIPQMAKIKILGAAIIGVVIAVSPLLILAIILVGLKPKEEIYGSARFASKREIQESGLLPTPQQRKEFKYPSILIGKYENKLMYFSGQQFLYLSAPTRSGKGVGIVIPNLLTYQDSVVVLDIKLENFEYSAGFRKSQGQEIFLFSPDGYANSEEARKQGILRSHRYNPLHYVRRDPKYRDTDIRNIFTIIFPPKPGDLWNDLAANFSVGMTSYLMDLELAGELGKDEDGEPLQPTFAKLVELGGEKGGYVGVINRAIQDHDEGIYTLSQTTLAEFNKFIALHDSGQQSVLMTFYAEMNVYTTPTCKAAMSGNDFDFDQLRRKRTSIYIGLTPNGLATYSKLINLFFSQLIMANTKVLPSQDPNLKYQVLLVLDEFPALGAVNILADAIGITAGYNVRYLIIVQDHSQIEAIYGKERANNLHQNCMIQLVYPPKEVNENTNRISETLGYKTVKTKETSYTYTGTSRSRNVSTKKERRALMLPQEIVELGTINHKSGVSLKEIVIMEKVKPFIADKIIYFDEPAFNNRKEYSVANIPEIPLLKFDLPTTKRGEQ
ncbi:type IV secretory system conjugative DNA transfer family protein [Lonepinella sp. BR2882]|uniref:type IV secretory system conjugative DNA transfer family protein n=1 Tax=Lonepinella sp. BR2882 TaxID=3095283 RepID=UPI003F6DBEF7